MSEYVIECSECVTGDQVHRSECLVALLEDLEPGEEVVFDASEVRALHALRSGGLLPASTRLPNRRLKRTGS